jgi:ubiquinone/menaquinone biosynthesis C-methylase UbiE
VPNLKSEKDQAEARFDRVAAFYDAFNFFMELFASKHRREILQQARGDILEVGVGTGSSFRDYPLGKRIIAVDISREMLRRAEEKSKNYKGIIKLHREDVQTLSFKDETFDTVFTSWVFCSVTNPVKGLTELRRVLKKDGQLLMLEHVRSKGRVLGYLMDKLNPLVARIGVDNINRDTEENLRKAGFNVKQVRNLAYDVVKAIVAVK